MTLDSLFSPLFLVSVAAVVEPDEEEVSRFGLDPSAAVVGLSFVCLDDSAVTALEAMVGRITLERAVVAGLLVLLGFAAETSGGRRFGIAVSVVLDDPKFPDAVATAVRISAVVVVDVDPLLSSGTS